MVGFSFIFKDLYIYGFSGKGGNLKMDLKFKEKVDERFLKHDSAGSVNVLF